MMRRAALRIAILPVALIAALWAPPLFAFPGDVTDDGVVDLKDALALCRYLSGGIPSLPAPRNGDLDFDGEVAASDLDLLMGAMVGVPLQPQPLDAAPASLGFGVVTVGSSASLDVVLGNTGSQEITLQQIALTVATPDAFTIVSAPATPSTLAPSATTTVTVRFAPLEPLSMAGSLLVLSTGGDGAVGLSGRGAAGILSVAPLALDFGLIYTGDEQSREIVIRNTGAAAIEVASIALDAGSSAGFSILYAPSTPFTLPPRAQRSVSITYAPAQAGTESGALEIVSSAGAANVSLVGRGQDPPP